MSDRPRRSGGVLITCDPWVRRKARSARTSSCQKNFLTSCHSPWRFPCAAGARLAQETTLRAARHRRRAAATNSGTVVALHCSLRPATSDAASLLRDVPGVSLWRRRGFQPAVDSRSGRRSHPHRRRHGPDRGLSQPHEPGAVLPRPSNVGLLEVLSGHLAGERRRRQHRRHHRGREQRPVFAEPGQERVMTRWSDVLPQWAMRGGNLGATFTGEPFSVSWRNGRPKATTTTPRGRSDSAAKRRRAGRGIPLDEVGSHRLQRVRNHDLGFRQPGAATTCSGGKIRPPDRL